MSDFNMETPPQLPVTNSQREIAAMSVIAESLIELDESGARRVMSWVADHFGYRISTQRKASPKKK